LILALHTAGINVRLLGYVYERLTRKDWKVYILMEMLTRIIKEHIRTVLKDQVLNLKVPGEAPYKTETILCLNALLGHMSVTQQYWETYILAGFIRKFNICTIQIVAKDQAVELPQLENLADWKLILLKKVSDACGLCWDPYFFPELHSNKNFFNRKSPIAPMALIGFSPQIRRMNVALRSKAYLLKTRIQPPVTNTSNSVKRTISLFMEALHTYTQDTYVLIELGHLYELMGKLELALEYYKRALEVDPNNEKANLRLLGVKEDMRL